MNWKRLLLLVICVFVSLTAASAQRLVSVNGLILDPSSAAVAGASVLIEDATGKTIAHTQTDSRGSFVLTAIPTGAYTLAIPANLGFSAKSVPLNLTKDISGMKVVLASEVVSQTVDVDAEQSLSTDPAANRDTVTVSGDELRKLPVFDQDFIAAMTPFLDPSSGSSGGVTLIVDGVEMKSVAVSASAIQEVRINNDPYSAEFTRPGRGRIEIITKPGSSEFHGEANFIFRDAIFNAQTFPAIVRPPESREIYEGHVRGPVGHDGHTNFIVSTSLRYRDTAVSVDAIGPNGRILENALTPSRNYQATMRVTHDFSPRHRLQAGYNYEYGTNIDAGVGGIVLPEAGSNTSGREDDAIFNDRIIVTPKLINQLQVTFEKDEDTSVSVTNAQAIQPGSRIACGGPYLIQISGSLTCGSAQADNSRTENTIHINEIVSWSHGRHYLRFGVQLPQMSRRAVDDRTNRVGTFQFGSIADFTAATQAPQTFIAQQGPGRGLYWANEVGGFIQDQVKLSPKLEASLGLRYDWQTYITDNNNFSPRISFSYAPDKGKTILRSGVGVFYDRTGGDFPATVKLHNGIVLHTVQLENPSYPFPPNTNFAMVPTNIVRMDPNIRAPYSYQYSLGVERQVHKGATITAAYRGSVQAKSFRSVDVNAPILPSNPSLTAIYARPNTNFGRIQQVESSGRSQLNALDISFRGRAGRVFSGQAQYTVSRFMNNTGGISAFPQDQYHPNAEWGRADQDRLQRFNLMGNINPDHWLTLGVSATLYSGAPYSETTGNDDFHTGLGNARPAGVGRNTLQGGGTADLDLLWDHDFYLTKSTGDHAKVLSCGVSAFNILNRTNYSSYIGTQSSALFMQPSAALPGRQMQFSLGYRF